MSNKNMGIVKFMLYYDFCIKVFLKVFPLFHYLFQYPYIYWLYKTIVKYKYSVRWLVVTARKPIIKENHVNTFNHNFQSQLGKTHLTHDTKGTYKY